MQTHTINRSAKNDDIECPALNKTSVSPLQGRGNVKEEGEERWGGPEHGEEC